ncbi:MAG: AraC family transcriptional regulator [Flavobacteriales bacterium]|nr:AraC family transcriptional regulator [Flavobacteriales bacterium]
MARNRIQGPNPKGYSGKLIPFILARMYHQRDPKSAELKKHIRNFDIIKQSNEIEKGVSYYAFPQRGVTISFLNKAKVQYKQNEMVISPDDTAEPIILFLGKYLQPLKLSYTAYVQEISLNFSESGISYFFDDYFNTLGKEDIQLITPKDIGITVEELNWKDDFEVGIDFIEQYFLCHLKVLNITGIEKAIELINENPSIQTRDLAQAVFMTEKTMNRQFKRYVGCSNSQFKKIIKFRKTINDHFQNHSKSLTDLCFDNNYFDSPHFYKQISGITQFKPRDFFKNVSKVGLKDYPYIHF